MFDRSVPRVAFDQADVPSVYSMRVFLGLHWVQEDWYVGASDNLVYRTPQAQQIHSILSFCDHGDQIATDSVCFLEYALTHLMVDGHRSCHTEPSVSHSTSDEFQVISSPLSSFMSIDFV